MIGSNLITQSRLRSLATCPRQHAYRYEIGLVPIKVADALRFGTMFHEALDLVGQRWSLDDVVRHIHMNYSAKPEWADQFEWDTECEKVVRLLCGYVWYWQADGIEVIETERVFQLPILNPETGAPTPLFNQAGKKDKKVRLPDQRIAMMEHKTTGDSIDDQSDYWSILRLDPQISMYFAADPELQTIIYDVIAKPGISPRQTKTVEKVMKDEYKSSGKWYGEEIINATMDLPERETIQMYGARLSADITANPTKYYARKEVARMDSDTAAFHLDLWQKQQELRWRQRNNSWPRNPSQNTCTYCAYKRPCFANVWPIVEVPDGFQRTENIHPELKLEDTNGDNPITNN